MKADKGLAIGCCYYPAGETGKWTRRQPEREGNLSLSDSRLSWQPDGCVSSAALQDSNLPDQGGRETQYLERISSPGCRRRACKSVRFCAAHPHGAGSAAAAAEPRCLSC